MGIGEQTELRYEMGTIPEPAHNSAVLSAMARECAERPLEQNGERITKKSRDLVRDYIEHFDKKKTTDGVFQPLHDQADLPPCPENGFRGWDFDRISELAIILSERCTQLTVTKFQEAMFFADSLSYEHSSRSLTGLVYVHGTYGPMINNCDALLYELQEQSVVTLVPYGDGAVLLPAARPQGLCSKPELHVIDEVVEFVNSFRTASELSECSHGLSIWANTKCGQTIGYTSSLTEASKAVETRLPQTQ